MIPKSFSRLTSILLLLLLGIATPSLAKEGFQVVVSIKPIHSLVAGLMEGTTTPLLLVDGTQSPYDFRLNDTQQEALASADLVIWVGPELEPNLAAPLKALGSDKEVIELLAHKLLKILPARHDDSQRDPFFWLDDRNIIMLVNDLTRILTGRDPEHSHIYTRNRRHMMARLTRIDRELEYGYRGMKASLGVQYYDTLRYFEQAYALKILNRVTPSPLYPVTATAMLRVRQRIVDGEAACLFTEAGMSDDNNILLLTQGTKVNVGVLDSLGSRITAGPDLYFELMRHNTKIIKQCLNVKQSGATPTAAEEAMTVGDGIGGRFMLLDHYGKLITEKDMLGSYQLVYFGYTFCPDVCPTGLQVITQALNILGDKAERIQPYFVTIDPERDTVKVMRNYVSYFDPRLIGITGSKKMIDRMAAQFKVKYEKVTEDAPSPAMYLMDHSASVYLMGPDGRFITKFAHGIKARQMAKELGAIIH